MLYVIDSYEKVIEVIFEINQLHEVISSNLRGLLNYNLKKTVSSVVKDETIENSFQSLITEYKTALNSHIVDISAIQNKCIGVRYRIKQAESINEKLLYYMSEDHENGKIPLNKCLNDFLGFRIMVNSLDDLYRLLICDTRINGIVKMYIRKDGKYKGLHVYFKNKNNKFFPWELQIWDVEQSRLNEISHKEHKQKRKYISLPQNYYAGNLEKEG